MALVTRVWYSLHIEGSFGVVPSSINSEWERDAAQSEALQEIRVTMGDLQIVLLVCDDIDDAEIYKWINFLKTAALGLNPPFKTSDYFEEIDTDEDESSL